MPIHLPGIRDKKGRKKGGKRSIVMTLSLTAMVDLFTVLVVFLLQNYNTTGAVIEIRDNVTLPSASAVKELKPSNVVVVSKKGIFFNEDKVDDFHKVKEQEDWMVGPLKNAILGMIKYEEKKMKGLKFRLKKAVTQAKGRSIQEELLPYERISIQADKSIDFLTIKKIMYTLTESGIIEINFAVMREKEET